MNKSFWVGVCAGVIIFAMLSLAGPFFHEKPGVPNHQQLTARHIFAVPECMALSIADYVWMGDLQTVRNECQAWCSTRYTLGELSACQSGCAQTYVIADKYDKKLQCNPYP
ncbi:MAG: hypothetical protein CVU71_16925 [Deltaproteobacteria bacterium HGW-Deltaproteobacteria-6]|jgi:hypothetical protein|nr:MAG: hypothetical protein CVU71_16925 [Deltaproteobacteria bacterium HGW-Deltaproteobacteria-6]